MIVLAISDRHVRLETWSASKDLTACFAANEPNMCRSFASEYARILAGATRGRTHSEGRNVDLTRRLHRRRPRNGAPETGFRRLC